MTAQMVPETIPLGKHVESDISFDVTAGGKILAVKKYRVDHPCVAWLNRHLSSFYDPAQGLPVAQHEFRALQLLAPHGFAPAPVLLSADSITMEFAGTPLHKASIIPLSSYKKQGRAILDVFKKIGFKHNDLTVHNALLDNGRLKIIDFTLSEFGGISIMDDLPDPSWARAGQDELLLKHYSKVLKKREGGLRKKAKDAFGRIRELALDAACGFSNRRKLKRLSSSVYSYHNLGARVFPQGEEKTPFGNGERYNYDRMAMMVSNYDFGGKSVLDLGCNSGWFCVQARMLGAGVTVGIDHAPKGMMGQAIRYAVQYEKTHRLGIHFLDENLEGLDLAATAGRYGLGQFDCVLLLSVLHHIGKKEMTLKAAFFARLYQVVKEVIFYEDHEFWNQMTNEQGQPIEVKGDGYRYGWNEDTSWQRKIGSIESYEDKILDYYRSTWRNKALMMDRFSSIRFLGFSEKRRPMLAMVKSK